MQQVKSFFEALTQFYANNARSDLPWRQPEAHERFDGYKILVSELMLQQTQVNRVIPKYRDFLQSFPDMRSLANARMSQILQCWNGLGYNRRARFLHDCSKLIYARHRGVVPRSVSELSKLPGIGPNTAAAISVYTYNERQIFIETNIRTVFIFHFYKQKQNVSDTDILNKLHTCLDEVSHQTKLDNRNFYWALMDYGSYLKKAHGNASRQSSHYALQPKFKGSVRQLRGAILRQLISGQKSSGELQDLIADPRLDKALRSLENDRLIIQAQKQWKLAD